MIKSVVMSMVLIGAVLPFGMMAQANDQVNITKGVHVPNLEFKTLIHALYPNQTTTVKLSNDAKSELANTAYVGLKSTAFDFDEVNQAIAIMHPVHTYKNTQGQTRHLVLIEKIALLDNGDMMDCYICPADGDLLIFKQSGAGFELVSRSDQDTDFGRAYGRLTLAKNWADFGQNIKPIKHAGKTQMAGTVSDYVARNTVITTVYVLSENRPIHTDEAP